jgi:serine/threonine protein kinase
VKPDPRRTCEACGAIVPAGSEGCPVCALRGALDDAHETSAFDVDLAHSSAGLRFDHYQILTREDGTPLELGHGAMGVTYKAIDINLRCAVALKVINGRFIGDESARRRFVREARAAASVRHPNVASVFHLGQSGEGYFYAMEYVEGETLENLIKRCGRIEPKVALEITSQVAAGLGAIHEQNLVHRDIKPTNIMVSLKDGGRLIAKIIDLGLAKPITDASSGVAVSTPGAFAGTPEFASPEQFAGVPVDIRSDLYSLGVTLWEMLTGNAPFRGTPGEVMHQHQHAPLPLERLEDLPQPLVVLLEVLLQKDPGRRFQDPAEFLKAIPTITGAIDARRMRTIRVFVSSPGDVQKERKLADNLIRSVAAEFGVQVSVTYSNLLRSNEIFSTALESDDGTLVLCPYFWEYQRFRPDEGYQEQIPNPAEFDLVICILWSRLGTQLAPKFVLPDGSPPRSGTDYEIAWALSQSNQTRGVPALHLYRNRSTPHFPLEPEDRYKELVDQWRSLKDFFARWEENSEGHFVGAFNNYLTLDEFEDLFRTHFRDYLLSQLDRGTSHRMLAGKTKRWLENPFRGLEVFEFEHAPIFRGRTKAVGELLDLLIRLGNIRKPFVLVIGASGSGKSSFVRAGVLPLLTEPGIVEGIGLWRRAVARPAAAGAAGDPFDALAAALLNPAALPELADQESASPVTELADELRENPAGVALRVKDALRTAALRWKDRQEQFLRTREEEMKAANRPEDADSARQRREQLSEPRARLALVVDQLEELFTTGFSPEIQEKYVSAVSGLARSGRVFIIATLRSDFYARYQEFPELVELAKEGRFDLRPPGAGEIRAIIQQPAEAAGLSFERDPESGESLDEALRDAAIKNPESLPLLQHALDQLFHAQAERQDNLLRWSDYRALGGVGGALAKHAEATFEKLHPHEQGAFPVVMGQLVTLGQGEEEVPNRRSALYADFSSTEIGEQSRAGAQGFINLFVKNRLLVADTDPSGNVVISVAHEALLRHWSRVHEWLAVNREFLRMRDRLDANLQIWKGRGRQKADLVQSVYL